MPKNSNSSLLQLKVPCPKRCEGPSKTTQPLVISKKLYTKLIDYTTKDERLAESEKREATKLAEIKEATYEMSKDWHDAIKNVQKKWREDLLSKKQRAQEARIKFVKELAIKNAAERIEIVKEARKLLFYKKPECRLINSALLTSESYRELDAQLVFRKKLESINKEQDNVYAEFVKKDTEDFLQKEQQKAEETRIKTHTYAAELKKQIEDTCNNIKKVELLNAKAAKEDLDNARKEIEMIEKCEKEELEKKKDYVQKMLVDQLKEKKRLEDKMKEDEEIENHYIEAYRTARDHLNTITKMKWKERQGEKIKRSEILAKKCAVVYQSNESAEEERTRRAVAEKDQLEAERAQAKRQAQEKMRADIKRYEAEAVAWKKKREQEEKNLIEWETYQRCKRDEYNKEMQIKAAKEEERRKKEVAEYLRKQMAEQEAMRKMESIMDDDSKEVQKAIQRTNEKVLAYGEEVLQESNGVRPLLPIIKVIENFKKEQRLLSPKRVEEPEPPKPKRRLKKICTKPNPDHEIFHLG